MTAAARERAHVGRVNALCVETERRPAQLSTACDSASRSCAAGRRRRIVHQPGWHEVANDKRAPSQGPSHSCAHVRHGRCGGEPFVIMLQQRAQGLPTQRSSCQLPCLTRHPTLSSCGLEAPRTPHKRALRAASERCAARIRCCIARRLWGCGARRRRSDGQKRKVPRSLQQRARSCVGLSLARAGR